MLEKLKREVCAATRTLAQLEGGITLLGSAAAFDRKSGYVVIRPSGITPDKLKPAEMLVVELSGKVVEGEGTPATDLAAHVELFNLFSWVNASVHLHSHYATCFAQAERSIPAYGVTHADFFCGAIPCSRELTQREIVTRYESSIAQSIVDVFRHLDSREIPGALVAKHGAFAWGKDMRHAEQNAVALETAAHLAFDTERLNPSAEPISDALLKKHFFRRHSVSTPLKPISDLLK